MKNFISMPILRPFSIIVIMKSEAISKNQTKHEHKLAFYILK